MSKTFVFGHMKPDSDSVCSSISLSYLKNKLGESTEPRVLGNINNETKYILDFFNVSEPLYLNDVKVKIRNMHYIKNAYINETSSIEETFTKLNDLNVTGLPIVNEIKELIGYVNLKEIAKFLITGKVTRITSSYTNIINSIEGEEILRFDEEISGTVMALSFSEETITSNAGLESKHIVIVGDRPEIIKFAIESQVKLIVLAGNKDISKELIELASIHKVNIIKTPYLSYKIANKIRLSTYVKSVEINENPIKFYETDYRNDFIDISNKYGHTNYPVVKKNNQCAGMIRLVDSNNYDKKKVILVDHNQATQSVAGIEEADIVEIVDHHNLGTLGTNYPINFRSMPVGSTATLIYKLYKESYVMIPKEIAGLMLGAIISDTLLFKSPTTTDLDRETAEKLASIANVNIEEFGIKMFKAGSSINGLTYEEVLLQDYKSFKVDDKQFGIGQVTTLDFEEIQKDQEKYIELLNNKAKNENSDIIILFVTDIIKNGSYIFYNESAENTISEIYNIKNIKQGSYLNGIVSRKKQMLPAILEFITNK